MENQTFDALDFVTLASVGEGRSAAVLSTSMGTSSAQGTGYIEGCFHSFPTAATPFPGQVVGTGFEDYFDSAFWFGAASGDGTPHEYAFEVSGLVHFDRDNETENLSAYRNHHKDLLFFSDGGSLVWRVGDVAAKCTDESQDNPINSPQATTLTSYVWLYSWEN